MLHISVQVSQIQITVHRCVHHVLPAHADICAPGDTPGVPPVCPTEEKSATLAGPCNSRTSPRCAFPFRREQSKVLILDRRAWSCTETCTTDTLAADFFSNDCNVKSKTFVWGLFLIQTKPTIQLYFRNTVEKIVDSLFSLFLNDSIRFKNQNGYWANNVVEY